MKQHKALNIILRNLCKSHVNKIMGSVTNETQVANDSHLSPTPFLYTLLHAFQESIKKSKLSIRNIDWIPGAVGF